MAIHSRTPSPLSVIDEGAEQHSGVDHDHYETAPLAPAVDPPERTEMGYDEQFVKPEGRRGDGPALVAASVRLCFVTLRPRRSSRNVVDLCSSTSFRR